MESDLIPKGRKWESLRKTLMEKYFSEHDYFRDYKEQLLAEKDNLIADNTKIEDENLELSKEVKRMEIQLIEKNKELKALMARYEEAKKNYLLPFSEESTVAAELKSFNVERSKLLQTLNEVSEELNRNVADMGNEIIDIDFMKGEIESLQDKTSANEREIPARLRELQFLEGKARRTLKTLKILQLMLKEVEKKVKILYYRKEDVWSTRKTT